MARRLGASSVVHGSLMRLQSKVRLDLGLFETDGLRPIARASVTASPEDLAALTDSATWAVLRQTWQKGEAPSPSLGAITTRSISGLRAFLDGERLLAASKFAAAADAFGHAIEADSSFWLAYWRLAYTKAVWLAAPVVDRAIPRLLARLVGLRRPAHPPGSVHGHRVRRVAGGAGAHATARPRPGRGVDPPDVGGGPPAGYRRERARAAGADTRVDCSRGRHHRPRYSIGESHYLSSSRSARALGGRFRLSHTRGGCSHDLQWSAPTRRPAHVRVQPSRHRHALPRAPARASSGHRGGAVARSVARVGGARRVGFCFGCGPAVRERVCHSRRRAGRVPARRGRELAWRGGSCRGSALADGGGRLDRRPDCRAANRGDLAGWLSRDDPGGLPRSRCGAPGARKRRYQGRPNS